MPVFFTSVGAVSGMEAIDLALRIGSRPIRASIPVCPVEAKFASVLSIQAVDCVLNHLSFFRMSDILRAVRNAASRCPSSVCVISTIAICRSGLL